MTFANSLHVAKSYFPDLEISYKDESPLMKLLRKILFFNQDFANYTTTIGSKIYFKSRDRTDNEPELAKSTLCHELAHMYSSREKTAIVYSLSYLFPQILVFAIVPVFFFFSLFKALLCLLFLLPLPSHTRKNEELMGYTIALYAMHRMNITQGTVFDLEDRKEAFIKEFSGPSYYFMWYLPGIRENFERNLKQIRAGERPTYDSALYEMIDDVIQG